MPPNNESDLGVFDDDAGHARDLPSLGRDPGAPAPLTPTASTRSRAPSAKPSPSSTRACAWRTSTRTPLAEDAHATHAALRARLRDRQGLEHRRCSSKARRVMPIEDDYRPDPTIPTMTTYPGGRRRGSVRDQPLPAHQHQPAGHHAHARPPAHRARRPALRRQRRAGGRTSRPSTRSAW